MAKKEAKFNTIFNHWLKQNPMTGAFELKQTTDALPFSALATHQELALLNVKQDKLIWKIPDCGFQNPFDCFCFNKQPAFVVIYYQKSKKFYLIDIENFVFYRDNKTKRKSLTEKEAFNICHLQVEL